MRHPHVRFRAGAVVIAILAGLYSPLAGAMPIYDYSPYSYRLDNNWLSHGSAGILSGVSPAADPIMGRLPNFEGDLRNQSMFTLESDDGRSRLRRRGDDFFQRLSNRDLIQADAAQEAQTDRTDVEVAINLDAFTREAMSNSFARAADRLDNELGLAAPDAATQQQPLSLTPAQQPGQDVPLLSAMQLGTLAVEVMGPELRQAEVFGHSLTELNELRKYMLVSEPVSGNLMMVDAQQQRALVVSSDQAGASSPLDPSQRKSEDKGGATPTFEEDRTLVQMIWDMVTSEVAMVIYGILLLIWMTWRYLLRKYV